MKFSKYHQTDISEKKFLITGGAGFIGSNLLEYLVQHGAQKITILDNLSTGYIENIQPFLHLDNVIFLEGDIREFDMCKKATADTDYVLHQAALGSVPRSINDPLTTNEVNITGFLNVINASKDSGVKRMVYAASSSTYGDSPFLPKKEEIIGNPLSPYAITKYVNELYGQIFSKVYNFHSVGLRYFNVFGPKQNINGPYAAVIPLFITQMLNDKSITINGNGETTRDFTFISNVVQANIKALFSSQINQHEVFNVACNEQTSLVQLTQTITQLLNKSIEVEFGPERKGDVKHSLADISKARDLLDYKPDILFKEGLQNTVAYFKDIIR